MAFALTVTTTHTKTLVSPSTGSEDKVYGDDYVSATSHTSTLAVADATSGGLLYFSDATTPASSGLLAANSLVIGGGAGAAPFTDAGLTYNATTDVLTSGSVNVNGTSVPVVGIYSRAAGVLTFSPRTFQDMELSNGSLQLNAGVALNWSSGNIPTSSDTMIGRGGAANSVYFSNNIATNGQNRRTEINKAITAFTDAVAKAVLTFTIPNAAHSASFLIRVVGSLGAGGAVGANESTQTATYQVDIARTAGVNAVATISAVYTQAAAATVAGGQNIATTAALSAISGDVGASNTFTVNATLTRAGAGATNHTALVHCSLLNANATGVTVA